MYYERNIKAPIETLKKGFPIIAVTGPRQAGKTTFLQHYFSEFAYFNLESPDTRVRIESDPLLFLAEHPTKMIIDEVQRVPELLSYLQAHVDQQQIMGGIVISGSENLLLSEKIGQSLAGRAAYQVILPFSLRELQQHGIALPDDFEQIFCGYYPALYTRKISPAEYYRQYLATYIERDVRQIRNVVDLSQFQKFVVLLAGRVGQILNVSSIASDVGISPNTAEDWLSILEASYIVYRLQPYYRNIGKRLIRAPKLYFYDTGLLASLIGIASPDQLKTHYAMGSVFENAVVMETYKHLQIQDLRPKLYFYRDNHGNELDLVIDLGIQQIPIEIKASQTYNKSFHKGLDYWRKHVDSEAKGFVVYRGEGGSHIQSDTLLNWRQMDALYESIP